MTKEEVIKAAYGEHWEYFKDKQFDDNGYAMFEQNDDNHKIWEEITMQEHPYAMRVYRPISLSGIENNNGWIKIESEADLPKESCRIWVVDKKNIELIHFTNSFYTPIHKTCTHYHPINEPKPPLF
jgi:hypothetical protein